MKYETLLLHRLIFVAKVALKASKSAAIWFHLLLSAESFFHCIQSLDQIRNIEKGLP